MEFTLSTEAEQFREELRGWLASHPPPRTEPPLRPGCSSQHLAAEAMLAWARTLSQGRWLGLSWSVEYGGRGLGLVEQMIFYEETARYDPPQLGQMVSLGVVGPTLLAYGSEAQKRRFLPRILSVEDIWCLGFSEPGSGSDLASLRTRATPRGDGFVVSGAKIWTSHASMAEWCLLLARGDPEAERHRGLCVLLLPMSSPGVEVRPIHNLVGEPHFAQLFLNDVFVSREHLVGEVGQGWTIVNTSLAAERDLWVFEMAGELRTALGRALERARLIAASQGQHRHAIDRQALSQAWIELEILRLSGLRSVTAALRGAGNPLDASRHKVFGSELAQRVAAIALDLLGPYGQCTNQDPHAPDAGLAAYQYLTRRSSTLISGTSEVQRNILAQRVLGLPRA